MIAILINTHKNKEQTQRLINKLRHKEVDIYVHIDKKFEVESFENAKTITKRYDIKWGDESIIKCIISSLEEITKEKEYVHYILLSGQDYPIKSIDEIVNFLKQNKNKEFLDYKKIGTGKNEWNVSNRYSYYRYENRIINFISRKLWNKREIIKNTNHYGGSLWWILTNDSIKYIISEYHSKKILNKLKHTVCIDEVFFQTILCNSKFKKNIINQNYRYIDWSDHMQGKNKGNPNILKEKDYQKIITSNNFFARKFDLKIDSKILDMLDNYIIKEKVKQT